MPPEKEEVDGKKKTRMQVTEDEKALLMRLRDAKAQARELAASAEFD